MQTEPRQISDYESRQVEAARRVMLDVAQVLASFKEAMVIIGGWVPELSIATPSTPHIGSIDVDIALDAQRLADGRYAELLKLLLDTGRYKLGDKHFQLVALVDLYDRQFPIEVDLEFLTSSEVKLKSNRPKLIDGFRTLQFEACSAAFHSPVEISIEGFMLSGARNSALIQIADLPDFLIMKAHAIQLRDKPKDVYDFCFCLDNSEVGITALAASWRQRRHEPLVKNAIEFLRDKFATPQHYGPQQLANFHSANTKEDREFYARRAYELVNAFLEKATPPPGT